MKDLEVLQDWYLERGVPDIGVRLIREVVSRVQMLIDHPEMGRVVPEFGLPFLREILHPPFRIVYRREPDRVTVVRVWRGERPLQLPEPE